MFKISSIVATMLAFPLTCAASKPRTNSKKVNLKSNLMMRKNFVTGSSDGNIRSRTNPKKNLETQELLCTDSDEIVNINKMSGISNRTKLKNNLKTHEKNVTDSSDLAELAYALTIMVGIPVVAVAVGTCIAVPVIYYFCHKTDMKPFTVWDMMIRLCKAEVCVKKYIETHQDNNQFKNQFRKVLVGNNYPLWHKKVQEICSCKNIEEMLNILCDFNLIREVIKCPPNIEAAEKFLRNAGVLKN